MKVDFHPAVRADVRKALAYFDREGGRKVGDRFFAQLEALLVRIGEYPTRFGFFEDDIRRASLGVFRYHLLYRVRAGGVRVLVLRHDRRHPSFGLSRR